MARNGIKLKELEEIKRLWGLGLTNRQIAKAVGIHRNTINKYVEQFKQPEVLHSAATLAQDHAQASSIDWEKVRTEYLGGVPLTVIHEELLESNQLDVQYSGFWKQAQKNISLTEASMVRIFKPGDRTEIDYADGIDIIDPATGEIKKTEFFVGVLCHSRYAFAEFTLTQSSSDFLESHVNMFEFFGGSTQVLSPDNLKSAVKFVARSRLIMISQLTRRTSRSSQSMAL